MVFVRNGLSVLLSFSLNLNHYCHLRCMTFIYLFSFCITFLHLVLSSGFSYFSYLRVLLNIVLL